MIHHSDFEVIESLLGTPDIPEDVSLEYELRQQMYHSAGGTGPLRALALVDLLRFLGYGSLRETTPEGTDWRQEIGKPILAMYGDREVSGILNGLGQYGTLLVSLDGYDGEVELPRYCVKLAPQLEFVMEERNDTVEKMMQNMSWKNVINTAKNLGIDFKRRKKLDIVQEIHRKQHEPAGV